MGPDPSMAGPDPCLSSRALPVVRLGAARVRGLSRKAEGGC
jgi:hypothetical protein